MKKKFLCIIMFLIILILCTNVLAIAIVNGELSSNKFTTIPGDEVEITMKLKNLSGIANGINAYEGVLEYDKEVFEVVTSSDFTALNGWDSISFNEENGRFISAKNEGILSSEDVVKIRLRVKSNAKTGSTTITISDIKASEGIEDIVANPVSVNVYVVPAVPVITGKIQETNVENGQLVNSNVQVTINSENDNEYTYKYTLNNGETWMPYNKEEKLTIETEGTTNIVAKAISKENVESLVSQPYTVIIDKTAPTGNISYSKTNITNQNVEATITFNEENVRITNNNGNNKYIFTQNGQFTFEYVDQAGNVGNATAKVTWIDKTTPIGSISYSETNITNKDVEATITFNEENVRITNNNGSNKYTFTQNGQFTFEYVDQAGNVGSAIAKVTWINKKVELESDKYVIEDKYISRLDEKTNVETLLSNFRTNGTIEIYNQNNEKIEGQAKIGTGMKLRLSDGKEYKLVVTGDLNGDGNVSITDLSKMKLHLIRKQVLENEYEKAVDMNKDGNYSITDLSKMKLYMLNK